MAHKILIADDSLTVQKVVSITLASYDYELVECKDESQLNEQLMIGGASLLLLDLNLSEGKSGYEVAKEVRAKIPNLPIVLLLGTFDTVDEAAFDSAGLNDRIVKPFESSIFIQKIQTILEQGAIPSESEDTSIFSGETESNFLNRELEDITPSSEEVSDNGDNWVVDSPSPEDKSSDSWDSFSQEKTNDDDNALEASLEGWGMNVPGTIGTGVSEMDMDLPSVISEQVNENVVAKALTELDIVHDEIESLPAESDLDYPDVGDVTPEKGEQSVFKEVDHEPTSAFLSTDEFNLDVSDSEEEDDLEKTDPQFTLPSGELISGVEEEADDADDFWAADEPSDGSEPLNIAEELEAEEEVEEYHAEPDFESSSEITQDSISLEPLGDPRENQTFETKTSEDKIEPAQVSASAPSDIDKDALVAKIIEELKPALHEMIESYCKETIESVAWQIIPDLAENLIRSEIKEIKESSASAGNP